MHKVNINDKTDSIDKKVFDSVMKHHKIIVEIDFLHTSGLINTMSVNPLYPQEFAILLNDIVDELAIFGIDKIIQQITIDDWESNLSKINEFVFVNKNDEHNFVNIACNLDDFPKGVMKGLGFLPFDEQ